MLHGPRAGRQVGRSNREGHEGHEVLEKNLRAPRVVSVPVTIEDVRPKADTTYSRSSESEVHLRAELHETADERGLRLEPRPAGRTAVPRVQRQHRPRIEGVEHIHDALD